VTKEGIGKYILKYHFARSNNFNKNVIIMRKMRKEEELSQCATGFIADTNLEDTYDLWSDLRPV